MLCRRSILAANRFLSKITLNRCASENSVLEFKDIPTPIGLPLIGTTLSLIWEGGTSKLHRYVDKRHKTLGPIYKENIGPVSCVFVSDPDVMRSVFAQEGKYPVHVLPEAWTTYNELYGCSRGIFFMNGEEWLHFRRIMNPLLLKGDQKWIETACESGSQLLLDKIALASSKNMEFQNLEDELYKCSLDTITSILLGSKYQEARSDIEPLVKQLASIVYVVFKTTSKLQLIPAKIASKYNIPAWKNFVKSVDTALNSANNLVEYVIQKYSGGGGLLDKMKEHMLISEVSRIVTDLVLAAGDTTAYSLEWVFYLIAKHDGIQRRLREELKINIKEDESSLPLLRNVVRETLRLYPVAPFLTRMLPEESILNGYRIPAGTFIIMSIFTSGRSPKYFKEPELFLPDRWLRNGTHSTATVQHASLPFAIGARSCIGKKIAESQLQTTLSKILQNYSIELRNEREVDIVLKMVAVPSEPIRIKFNRL